MAGQGLFQSGDLKDEKAMLRKLNDNVTAAQAALDDLQSIVRVDLLPLQFATSAYVNPYDAPFPLAVAIGDGGQALGVSVVKMEKASEAGKARGPVGGVSVLWSNTADGRLLVESITGLEANTAYAGVLAVFR